MLTCSIGIASNKLLAKIASDIQKPNGLTIVQPSETVEFISKCSLERIPGIGPKTRKRLSEMGIQTTNELSRSDLSKLIEEFGTKTAKYIHNADMGVDYELVKPQNKIKQIGRIITLKKDTSQSYELCTELQELCRSVYDITVSKKLSFKNVGILLILDNLDNVAHSKNLKFHSSDYDDIYLTAQSVLNETMKMKKNCKKDIKVRRLGVKVSNLKDNYSQNTKLDFINLHQ